MAVHGHLHSMSLPDLLHWVSANAKSGVLELERNKICRRIVVEDGRIRACSSNDPPSRIGQFLLSRGLITQEELRDALERHEVTGKNLGTTLSEMGVIDDEQILTQIAAKAEENIYGLFDWVDAVFRFDETAAEDAHCIQVDLDVEEVLVEGHKRHEQLCRIREVFPGPGVVLARTETPIPAEVSASPMAARILESINGERTLAEVLLCAHASEYLVIKFLFMLHQRGIVDAAGMREVPDGDSILSCELVDDPLPELAVDSATRDAAPPAPEGDSTVDPDRLSRYPELAADIDLASQLMRDEEFGPALQVLNSCYRAHPGDGYLRHLVLRCETSYLDRVRREDIPPTTIPTKRIAEDDLAGVNLQPADLFLLGMIDGESDVKSILWVAPMREVDIFLALQRLRDQGLIELRPGGGDDAGTATDRDAPAIVRWT